MSISRRAFAVAASALTVAWTVLFDRASAQTAPASPDTTGDGGGQRRLLAKAVLDASGSDARLATINETAEASWLAALQKTLPNAKPEWRPVMLSVIRDELKEWNRRISEINVEIYATKFTDAQLTDMLAFYRTDGGRALVAQTPDIIREKAAAGRKLVPETISRLVSATCARVQCEAATTPE